MSAPKNFWQNSKASVKWGAYQAKKEPWLNTRHPKNVERLIYGRFPHAVGKALLNLSRKNYAYFVIGLWQTNRSF